MTPRLEPSWEVTLLRRPPDSARARVMGRVILRAANANRARQAADAALASRSGTEPHWSLGLLRPLAPDCPGTHAYAVVFAAWKECGERFVRQDVHRCDVWATDGAAARRQAAGDVQGMPGYLPTWRVRQVVRRGTEAAGAAQGGAGGAVHGPSVPRQPHRVPIHHARRPGRVPSSR
jgi:hypothetical protein